MLVKKRRLLKKNAVVVTDGETSMTPEAPGEPIRAAVVRNAETHAVIEVSCPCGRTIRLLCHYAS